MRKSTRGTTALRIVVVDDNPVVRAGLGVLLEGRADLAVVAEAADGARACDVTWAHRPDVVLLDVRMPGVDGISALPRLVALAPVLMLTYSREDAIVHESLRLGARGYLVHGEFDADQLATAVHDVAAGRAPFSATASRAVLDLARARTASYPLPESLGTATDDFRPSNPVIPSGISRTSSPPQRVVAQSASGQQHRVAHGLTDSLSDREVEVMDLIASGMTNSEIAATCFISEKTVKNHINRIFTKLHASSRSEAIARWLGTAPGGGATSRG
ncbi:response regulator [Streptomyces sp. NPDC048172]|uniref:response regulator n=1 Tax=Streptomyces sp. NPDC048172 TaxID=3365505 RepID=UPI0037235D73